MSLTEETLESLANKYCNSLGDENKFVRKSALVEINNLVSKSLQNGDLLSNFMYQIFKPIIRCFNDPIEVCREKAAVLLERLLEHSNVDEKYLILIIPTLHHRLGGEKVIESSEEVRLLFVTVLRTLVSMYAAHLTPYLSDVIDILQNTIIDPFPEVKVASCQCASELSQALPRDFHLQSESLISSLVQTLGHHQSKVRINAINAIGLVVLNGNNRSIEVVSGPLAERLFDQSPGVRKAVTAVVGNWLLNLRDRYSYFRFLLPLILTSLSDDFPDNQIEAAVLWDRVGLQYLKENEKDLQEKLDFLPGKLDHYPPKLERPNLGCRSLVQREMSKFLPAIAKELDDWVDDVKVKSAQLLAVVLLHAEYLITMHLEKILPTMYRAIIDADTRVSGNVERGAQTIGYFVPPDVYCKLVLPHLEENHHAGHVRLLAALISTTPKDVLLPLLSDIANRLSSSNVCHSKEHLYQSYLLEAVCSLLNVCEQDCQNVSRQLFVSLLSVLGLAAKEETRDRALELLSALSFACGHEVLETLYEQHIETQLETLKNSVETLSIQCAERFIFEAILVYTGPVIGQHINLILQILKVALDVNNDPEVVLKFLIIIARILSNWKESLSQVSNISEAMEELMDVLRDQLIWRAGLSAEALRTAAVACVQSALSVRPFSPNLPSKLLPNLLSLIEDQAHKTRLYALSSICLLVHMQQENDTLSAETVKKIYPEILKRLDDVNDEIRQKAAKCIGLLFKSPLPSDFDVSSSKIHFEFIFKTLLIHLDDTDLKFQTVVLETLKNMASNAPEILKEKLATQNFRDKKVFGELQEFVSDFEKLSFRDEMREKDS